MKQYNIDSIFKIGDYVESTLTLEQISKNYASDMKKAKELGVAYFVGNAATYLHLDESYRIKGFERGGVRLEGFIQLVSRKYLKLSNKANYR